MITLRYTARPPAGLSIGDTVLDADGHLYLVGQVAGTAVFDQAGKLRSIAPIVIVATVPDATGLYILFTHFDTVEVPTWH